LTELFQEPGEGDGGEVIDSFPSPRKSKSDSKIYLSKIVSFILRRPYNKNKITLWKPKEHCVQFAVVIYEKKKKRERERRERQTPPWGRQIGTSAPHF